MGEYAIETHELRKTFRGLRGSHQAVDGLELKVPRGGVHGFLGPNGSGKTTTIKMLLGLVHATSGSMQLLGHETPRQLPQVIAQVGAIVERPRFFPHFSGRLNLQLAADAAGVPKRRVEQVLDQVGLGERAGDDVKGYSLGMQQRLAIAATLLKDPELLIFDEPTNGLDPAGIHEVRETMRSLGREGRTVLVSSHLLSEVEQVADTLSIIGRGRLLAEGRIDELAATAQARIRVLVDEPGRAAQVLEARGAGVQLVPPAVLVDGVADASQVSRWLAEAGLYPRELLTERTDLEAAFLRITAGEELRPRSGPGIALTPLPETMTEGL